MVYLTEAFVLSADEYSFIVGKPRARPGRGIVIDSATYYTTAAKAASAAVLRAMRQGVADGSITHPPAVHCRAAAPPDGARAADCPAGGRTGAWRART